jgi:tetratricopeptide (TPR) repeat protein
MKSLPLKANLDLWSYYGKQDFLKGNFSGAEMWYGRCVEYNPVDGRGWIGLAKVHLKRSSANLAEKAYKDGLYYNPQNPYLMQAYAVMLDRSGRTQQALKLLTSSVKNNPKHAASWVELGRLNQKLGKLEEARYCFSSGTEGDPTSYVAWQAWGVLEAELGNVDKARELYEKSSIAGPKSVHALQAWATMEKRLGNLSEAERLLKKVSSSYVLFILPC